MQQSRHTNFEQNHLLMKISAKRDRGRRHRDDGDGSHWAARLPSEMTKEMRGTESVDKLHFMVDKQYLQDVGLVSD